VNTLVSFAELQPEFALGPLRLTVSAAANERYWRAAGVDHPLLVAGALYPPIAANLTIMLFNQHCGDAVIQTRQLVQCHMRADAGGELEAVGAVVAAYDKRGRAYCDIVANVSHEGAPLWTSQVSFTPVATFGARA
jgi:hypothetical protein